jgi:hypothetical protein
MDFLEVLRDIIGLGNDSGLTNAKLVCGAEGIIVLSRR